MLDKNTFIQGLAYIGKSYLHWDFNFQNMDIVEHWYSFFQNFDDVEFRTMIKEYCISEKYAPDSVASLLSFKKEQNIKQELPPHAAWEMVVDLIHQHGFEYGSAEIYNNLLEYPILRKTVWEFENTLRNLKMGDNYIAQRFQDAYKDNLKKGVEKKFNERLSLNAPKQSNLLERGNVQ